MIEYQTTYSPEKLLEKIKNIEHEVGRRKSYKWGPREIDIDLIFCKDMIIKKKNLTIPHKEFSNRFFILGLMAEIDEAYIVEGTGKSIKYFLDICPDKSKIEKVIEMW